MLTRTKVKRAYLQFAADVRCGLTRTGQKELPSKYLYDAVGSALFEVIGLLPEYGLTRADERVLRRNASEIVSLVPGEVRVAELGSGTGKKTRWLLEALSGRQPISYSPIDISRAALAKCQSELADVAGLQIAGIEAEYLDGLRLVAGDRRPGEQILLLFLGGTIGNFDRAEGTRFLEAVRGILEVGDALLIGTDLEKPVPQLLAAYDDAIGVTAAFNRNLLARINRELGADFDLPGYHHVALYDRAERRIEMHLRARCTQTVRIPKADLRVTIREDETIWTESSYKYSLDEPRRMAERSGFACAGQWLDEEWPFAESLLLAE